MGAHRLGGICVDKPIWMYVMTAVLGYLFGSISFSIVVSKMTAKIDVREYGSGNAGFTNVLRTLGAKAAVLTFLGDLLKSVIPTFIAMVLVSPTASYITGIACMIGHIFPVFFKFKGGKGIMVSLGMILVFDWRIALILLSIFLIFLYFSRYVSLSSMCGISCYPFLVLLFHGVQVDFLITSILTMLIVIYMHRANIVRLKNHTENKISSKKKA